MFWRWVSDFKKFKSIMLWCQYDKMKKIIIFSSSQEVFRLWSNPRLSNVPVFEQFLTISDVQRVFILQEDCCDTLSSFFYDIFIIASGAVKLYLWFNFSRSSFSYMEQAIWHDVIYVNTAKDFKCVWRYSIYIQSKLIHC